MPQADNLNAFPTTFILGRDGKVRGVHAGFASPAAGAFHEQTKKGNLNRSRASPRRADDELNRGRNAQERRAISRRFSTATSVSTSARAIRKGGTGNAHVGETHVSAVRRARQELPLDQHGEQPVARVFVESPETSCLRTRQAQTRHLEIFPANATNQIFVAGPWSDIGARQVVHGASRWPRGVTDHAAIIPFPSGSYTSAEQRRRTVLICSGVMSESSGGGHAIVMTLTSDCFKRVAYRPANVSMNNLNCRSLFRLSRAPLVRPAVFPSRSSYFNRLHNSCNLSDSCTDSGVLPWR